MSHIPILLGTAQLGAPESGGRVSDKTVVQELVDIMLKHGHIGIDTARIYGQGTSEELIGTLDFRDVARVDTKIRALNPGDFSAARIKEQFKECVAALNGKKIRVLYLHTPDRSVPFEDTLQGLTDIWKYGGFEEFGLSNFMAWEVAEIAGLCAQHGFVPPTVYEGGYNIVDRQIEAELLPCLRKLHIRFAAFCPLAGGLLTDSSAAAAPPNFSPARSYVASYYTERYMRPAITTAVAELLQVVQAHGLPLAEVALRWLQWHSMLRPDDHGVIVAADSGAQLEANLTDCEKGPLPEAVAQACEDAWGKVKGDAPNYWV
ncbi:aldo/keto reductase [Phanerochaete sordida]|uniref:Aldo/keto reductase n=1 Tax=Phanerochaete sordida TaxID=48140 RepID=A0A9P3GDN1_9APHY|nr:aldo/keto reductase [Phanerochaete sordida]